MLLCVTGLLAGSCDSRPDGRSPAFSGVPEGVVCEWARVVQVIDGDTVRADFEDGPGNQPVRYIGIDTPELANPEHGEQPFGREATNENEELVAGKRVCLEKDISETDRFGRFLRYVWLDDGTLVNEQLVREGLAVVMTVPPDVRYAERFLEAQRAAREDGAGQWGR